MNQFKLFDKIRELSQADSWGQGMGEWDAVAVYYTTRPERRICGKFPIHRICVLENRLNSNNRILGIDCVNKFCTLPWKKIIGGMSRLRKAPKRAMSYLTLVYARSYDWINRREFEAYAKMIRKRRLTPGEKEQRREINCRVLDCIRESEAYWTAYFDRQKSEDAAAEQVAQ